MQLRTQFADMYSMAAPVHKPCEAQAPHDGFRSTHPTSGAAAAETGPSVLMLAKTPASAAASVGVRAAVATTRRGALVTTAIGTGVGGGLGGAAVAAGVEHAGVQLRTQLTDM